ncbi:MAG: PIN domain-containing protein [Verrucomicrobia bacterium]|nr:PIN domain-containing protein [Verrucomicrobiota bacterium]MDA1006040.1 PIN domain-containing protein [Verrucomicrobiota bacterium]
MTSCDTNILFVALEASRPGHDAARGFLEERKDDANFALCELVLVELYVLLRNPAVARRPLGGAEAAGIIETLRSNPRWDILDYPGPGSGVMEAVWREAAGPDFARRRIFDVRLALTLRHHGVTEFATANGKDFEGFGLERVWNPLGGKKN